MNSLSGFKSVNLIGTQNENQQTNLAIFSSVVHLGANPALVGFVMRPDNGQRDTLNNIIASQHYTINQVSNAFYRNAHQTSARYPKEITEFSDSNLTPAYIKGVNAPFVAQSQLKYALRLKQILPIELNNSQFIIGEITHVICAENALQDDGYIDIEALQTVSVSGLDSYHLSQRLARLSYAKPDSYTSQISLSGAKKGHNQHD
ncbi:flavin oxidoreductase [Psychromonas marina]|uniref:Flavin oxidoreductase n=1 Tax=Psychromonas marina TaxID=88364 RepID=A0ABQ6DW24_9GAMM|nr:flavin oxidoreductase [Psychromonas marina]